MLIWILFLFIFSLTAVILALSRIAAGAAYSYQNPLVTFYNSLPPFVSATRKKSRRRQKFNFVIDELSSRGGAKAEPSFFAIEKNEVPQRQNPEKSRFF